MWPVRRNFVPHCVSWVFGRIFKHKTWANLSWIILQLKNNAKERWTAHNRGECMSDRTSQESQTLAPRWRADTCSISLFTNDIKIIIVALERYTTRGIPFLLILYSKLPTSASPSNFSLLVQAKQLVACGTFLALTISSSFRCLWHSYCKGTL